MTDFVWATQDALRDKLYDRIDDLETANADLLEALEYFYNNVIIDKYDACDEELNTAWRKAREAIRKHKGE